MKKVIVSCDHAGYNLRNRLAQHLKSKGYVVEDVGAPNSVDSVDYPNFAEKACIKFLEDKEYEFGLLVCGTGIGISIAANKIKGIRCALLGDSYSAEMAHVHNDANFIAFGERVQHHEPVEKILDAFLNAQFMKEGRHAHRLELIKELEENN